jgi:hypothetical protein
MRHRDCGDVPDGIASPSVYVDSRAVSALMGERNGRATVKFLIDRPECIIRFPLLGDPQIRLA